MKSNPRQQVIVRNVRAMVAKVHRTRRARNCKTFFDLITEPEISSYVPVRYCWVLFAQSLIEKSSERGGRSRCNILRSNLRKRNQQDYCDNRAWDSHITDGEAGDAKYRKPPSQVPFCRRESFIRPFRPVRWHCSGCQSIRHTAHRPISIPVHPMPQALRHPWPITPDQHHFARTRKA